MKIDSIYKVIELDVSNNRILLEGDPTSGGWAPEWFEVMPRGKIPIKKMPTHAIVWTENTDPIRYFHSAKSATDFINTLLNKGVKRETIFIIEIASIKTVEITAKKFAEYKTY